MAKLARARTGNGAQGPRSTRLAVVALVALLAVLGVLQWRWIGEVSRLERERTRRSLSEAGEEMIADLDRELLRAFVLFQPSQHALRIRFNPQGREISSPEGDRPPGSFTPASRSISDQLARWRESATYPGLVRAVYRASGNPVVLNACSGAPETCRPVPWPPRLVAARARIEAGLAGPEVEPRAPALLLPEASLARGPLGPFPVPPSVSTGDRGLGVVVVELDRDLIGRQILPQLAERTFHLEKRPELRLAVVGPEGVIYRSDPAFSPKFDSGDLWLPMLSLRGPVEFHRLLPELLHGTKVEGPGPRPILPGSPPHPRGRLRRIEEAFWIKGPEPPTGASGTWALAISDRAGSLEAAVSAVRTRNLGVSLAILGLLAASLFVLARSASRAHRLAEQRLEFVAGVTHELHTPIAAIRSAAQNLADGVVGEPGKVRDYGALLDREGARLSSLVAQALELAGIESGSRAFAPEPLAVAEAIDGALEDAGPALARAGLDVERDHQAEAVLPAALADRSALRLALRNLLENAAKYASSGGWVGIRTETDKGGIEIAVEDRGPGVAPEDRLHLFEPFVRGRSTASAAVTGAGLGLTLARRALAATGGSVHLGERPGGGSAFTIRLPRA